MAAWLRRLTKTQKGSSSASSNIADCVVFPGEHKLENTKQVLQSSKNIKLLRRSQPFGVSSNG